MARKKQIRRRRQPSNKKAKIITLLVLILILVGSGLIFLSQPPKEHSPQILPQKIEPDAPLPPPPEERWSYIKALENRTVEEDFSSLSPPPTPRSTQSSSLNKKITEHNVWSVLDTPKKNQTVKTYQKEERFGLQCGSFETPQPAEEQRAKLLMLGLDVQVKKSGKYYRVFVGPLGTRNEAQDALKQTQGQVVCLIIAM